MLGGIQFMQTRGQRTTVFLTCCTVVYTSQDVIFYLF